MDDCEEGQQTTLLQSPASHQSTSTRKRSTVLFGVVVTLAVVAVLAAVCALVAFYASGGGSGQASEPQSQKAPRQSVSWCTCVCNLHGESFSVLSKLH